MKIEGKEIEINGITYVQKGTKSTPAETFDGLEYKIIRCDRTGVFAGYVESQAGQEVIIRQARRLWYWEGAASLSQLAEEGVKKPNNCKFPKAVTKVKVLDAIEILDCTEDARLSIAGVPEWRQD